MLELVVVKKWICFCILFFAVLSFGQLSVEVKDEQVYNSSMLGLRVRVVNNSGQNYDNVSVDIYLKKKSSETFVLDYYYTENWTLSISEQSGENVVVHVTIPHVGSGAAPNESGVSVGIHRADWQPITKSSANGFPSGAAFTEALNYGVFQGGNLIGGTAYIDPNSVVPSLRFVGLQPEDVSRQLDENTVVNRSAWIEIENYGTTPADLSNMSLEWPSDTKIVSSSMLQPGEKIRICAVQKDCPNDDVVASESSLPVGVAGEVLLRYNGTAMDYLTWGPNAGVLAMDAREANFNIREFFMTGALVELMM